MILARKAEMGSDALRSDALRVDSPQATATRIGLGSPAIDDAARLDLDRKLQEAAFEIMCLRTQLAQLTNSRGYRFVERVYALRQRLMPPGSYRERLALAICRTPLSIKKAVPDTWHVLLRRPRTAGQPSIAPAATANIAEPTVSTQPLSATEDARQSRIDISTVPYFPKSWQIEQKPSADSRFLNLIILSLLHRSGSTLLQRVCNARKKTLIWGEHCAVLRQFADIYKSLAGFAITQSDEREEYFARGEDPNLWIANMCPDVDYVKAALVNSARALLNTLYRDHRESHDIVGFKEVQYGRAEAELLRQCYPEAKILFLVRHPFNMWNSTPRDWYPSFEAWINAWNTKARDFLMLASTAPNCHLIRYEDLVRKEPKTLDLLADVAQVTREEVSNVLGHKIGSGRVGISDAERRAILDGCREPMEALGYT
jgi:hypothetical protein